MIPLRNRMFPGLPFIGVKVPGDLDGQESIAAAIRDASDGSVRAYTLPANGIHVNPSAGQTFTADPGDWIIRSTAPDAPAGRWIAVRRAAFAKAWQEVAP